MSRKPYQGPYPGEHVDDFVIWYAALLLWGCVATLGAGALGHIALMEVGIRVLFWGTVLIAVVVVVADWRRRP